MWPTTTDCYTVERIESQCWADLREIGPLCSGWGTFAELTSGMVPVREADRPGARSVAATVATTCKTHQRRSSQTQLLLLNGDHAPAGLLNARCRQGAGQQLRHSLLRVWSLSARHSQLQSRVRRDMPCQPV